MTDFVGVFYNLNELTSILGNENFTPNKIINYIGISFNGLSTQENVFQTIKFGANDYLKIILNIPYDTDWVENINLISFTPYFFNYKGVNIFGSVDSTITLLEKDTKIKICCTSNLKIAKSMKEKGYIISYIPIEYINDATFLPIIRIDYITNINAYIPNGFEAYYYKSENKELICNKYANASYIKNTLPEVLPPKRTFLSIKIGETFDKLRMFLKSIFSNEQILYPYLSNVYSTPYPIENFYLAITTTPYAQIQGDDTTQCYFNSNYINITNSNGYFYIVSLNQNLMECGLTSNIQIYNSLNNSSILYYETSPNLPKITNPKYPYPSQSEVNSYPNISFYQLEESTFYSQNISSIYIVERVKLNPVNFNHTQYDKIKSSLIYYSSTEITNLQQAFMLQNFNVSVIVPSN